MTSKKVRGIYIVREILEEKSQTISHHLSSRINPETFFLIEPRKLGSSLQKVILSWVEMGKE